MSQPALKNLSTRPGEYLIHSTGVVFEGKGLLCVGPSGAGKTQMALDLMALGGDLIADDRVYLQAKDDVLIMQRPVPVQNLIELRGIGVVPTPSVAEHPVTLIINFTWEGERRSQGIETDYILGCAVKRLWCRMTPNLPSKIVHLLRHVV